jgi:multidrug transporter EmrE-like cation transporter
VFYLVIAALCFAAGGLLMKWSNGGARLWPTAGFLMLFGGGAWLQARAMRDADMGVTYIVVLGIEAIAALALSVFVLREQLTWQRCGAVIAILAGIVLLRRS